MGVEEETDRFSESIDWFLDHLRVERGASEHTIASYANDLRIVVEFLRLQKLASFDQMQPEHLLRFQASLRPPMKPATVQRRLSSLRSLLKFLKRRGAGPEADLPSTGGMKRAKVLPKALSADQLRALLEAPDLAIPGGLRDRVIMELIYGAGLRVSEAVGLRIDQLDLDTASLTVVGKREKSRWVPLPSATVEWIEKYLADGRPKLLKRPMAQLIVSDRGLVMHRATAFARLQRYSRLAGIEQAVSPHTLRHTYAVHLLKGGADLRVVQELLGHDSIATTQVYTQLDLDEVIKRYRASHPRR